VTTVKRAVCRWAGVLGQTARNCRDQVELAPVVGQGQPAPTILIIRTVSFPVGYSVRLTRSTTAHVVRDPPFEGHHYLDRASKEGERTESLLRPLTGAFGPQASNRVPLVWQVTACGGRPSGGEPEASFRCLQSSCAARPKATDRRGTHRRNGRQAAPGRTRAPRSGRGRDVPVGRSPYPQN